MFINIFLVIKIKISNTTETSNAYFLQSINPPLPSPTFDVKTLNLSKVSGVKIVTWNVKNQDFTTG